MKTLHLDALAIVEDIARSKNHIYICPVGGGSVEIITSEDLKIYHDNSFFLLGSRPERYIIVAKRPCVHAPPLKLAIDQEFDSIDWQYLLIAYADGGTIVFSQVAQDFQRSGMHAEWWCP